MITTLFLEIMGKNTENPCPFPFYATHRKCQEKIFLNQ